MPERSIAKARLPAKANAVQAARAVLEASLSDSRAVDLSWIDPPPPSDGWTLAADALRFVARIVRHLEPTHVLEFGSGLSTRMIVRTCAAEGLPCRISSIDHDPEFAIAPDPENSTTGIRLRHQLAPVVARDAGGKLLPQYLLNPRRFASRQAADLILVDGPPVILGGREGALYQALQYSRRGTLILLDDADRRSERLAISNVRDNVGDFVEVRTLPGFTKGMASIIVREPVPVASLWELKIAAAKIAIQASVPPNGKFVLIGDDPWSDGWPEGRRSVPLLMRDGVGWGNPENDEAASRELDVRCRAGADYLVILWPSYWWFEYYTGFFSEVRRKFSCILENDQVVIFDTRTPAALA